MTDRPIIFSGPMVRALLEGRKTQTRRLLKQPPPEATSAGTYWTSWEGATNRWTWLTGDPKDCDTWEPLNSFNAPYAVGDRLYVREKALYWIRNSDNKRDKLAAFAADGYELKEGEWWTPSIHMPREASRITLTVEAVKVERLQDISEEDAKAEGIRAVEGGFEYHGEHWMQRADGKGGWHNAVVWPTAKDSFRQLWQSLNAKRAPWDSNPWIVAITFKVHKCNIKDSGP